MTDPYAQAVEDIARWLEQCARYGRPWQRDGLARQLRSGEWQSMPSLYSDAAILKRSAEFRLDAGLPLSPSERSSVGLIP